MQRNDVIIENNECRLLPQAEIIILYNERRNLCIFCYNAYINACISFKIKMQGDYMQASIMASQHRNVSKAKHHFLISCCFQIFIASLIQG